MEDDSNSISVEKWPTLRLKFCLSRNDGGVWGNDPQNNKYDKMVIRSTEQKIDGRWNIIEPAMRDLSGTNYKDSLIKENDLIITKSSGSSGHIGKTSIANEWFSKNEAYFSNFMQRIRIKNGNPKYYWYILNSAIAREQFRNMQNSTVGIGNINAENIGNIVVPYPPIEKQNEIVNFLDKECGEIDEVLGKLDEEINILEQYKKSLIREKVTEGLYNTDLVASGTPWIGNVPKHWKIMRAKYCFRNNKNIVGFKADSYERLALTLNGVVKRSKEDNDGLQPTDFMTYQIVEPNDLIFKLIDLQNISTSRIGISDYEGIVSPAYIILKSNGRIDPHYAEMFYKMMWQGEIFNKLGDDGVRSNLNATDLLNLPILVPPLSEQKEIAKCLNKKCEEIDSALFALKEECDVLTTYKKSLVCECVLGKKEIVYE